MQGEATTKGKLQRTTTHTRKLGERMLGKDIYQQTKTPDSEQTMSEEEKQEQRSPSPSKRRGDDEEKK